MSYTAWPATSDIDVRLSALGITPRSSVDATQKQQRIDAVLATVNRVTRRTWIPVTETRFFDGSGVGVQELDEFISITAAGILYGVNSTAVDLTGAVVVEAEAGLPNTRIALSRTALPGWVGAWFDRFPAGRRNISVTASWGYGSTIPADLWDAVADEAALRVGEPALFNPGTQRGTGTQAAYRGRLVRWKNDTVSQEYDTTQLSDGTRGTKRFAAALSLHTRPLGPRLRRWRAPMI
jgi:hypothetical protein